MECMGLVGGGRWDEVNPGATSTMPRPHRQEQQACFRVFRVDVGGNPLSNDFWLPVLLLMLMPIEMLIVLHCRSCLVV